MAWFKRRRRAPSETEESPFDGQAAQPRPPVEPATTSGKQVEWQFGHDDWPEWMAESYAAAPLAGERYFYPMNEPAAAAPGGSIANPEDADLIEGNAAGMVVWSAAAATSHSELRRLTDAFRGPGAIQRVEAVRRALDRALEQWWAESTLPASGLLRDGLLVLEAGHDLDESQRSLLLRTATAYDRGILTALHHQTDPERTAYILAEAITSPTIDLPLERIQTLAYEDPLGEAWLPYLQHELVAYAEITPAYDELAMAALRLDAKKPAVLPRARPSASPAPESIQPPPVARQWVRLLLALLAFVLVVTLLLGDQFRGRMRDVIEVGGGTYSLRNVDGTERVVALDPYVIDRFEVGVADYRRCYAAGACVWPRETASVTRPDYLTNRTYDRYPMINVDWAAATAYCEWAGMRLPSEDEWQAAASYAPATARAYRYPWGDTFQPQVTNSLEGGQGDTTVVGSYQPSGNSPMGMADAAGNVAEWTSTTATGDPSIYRTKGGSFADGADYLQPQVVQSLPAANQHDWLGFRCAASPQ